MNMWKIGCIGNGFVGASLTTSFEFLFKDKVDIRIYDKYQDTESLESVVENSDIIFIALPTPMDFETGKCDTSILESVIKEIDNIKKDNRLILKSTISPGTTERLQKEYPEQCFIFSPEFLREKTAFDDGINVDRIILGYPGYPNHCLRDHFVESFFEAFHEHQKQANLVNISKGDIVHPTNSAIAEMVKYMGNAFLSTKVSFCNEMKEICDASGIDYDSVANLVALDKRIGRSHMSVPGHDGKHGYGGSCLPKDLNGLIRLAKDNGVDPMVLETIWTKNLLVREEYEWEKLAQVNGQYEKK